MISTASWLATSPAAAQRLGISTVYQEVNLIPTMSVTKNLTLGRQPRRFGLISWRTARSARPRAAVSSRFVAGAGRQRRGGIDRGRAGDDHAPHAGILSAGRFRRLGELERLTQDRTGVAIVEPIANVLLLPVVDRFWERHGAPFFHRSSLA